MNSKFKRLLACLLSLMMVVSIFPMSAITAFAAEADEITTVFEGNVAKVGNTEYATIDEAIAAWTNGTTLTLLSNVTLSDVIKLSSTEYHILDLGTYTMTAASKKDAIQIVNNGRSSASYTLDIKADATNPGGITASGKTVVVTTGKSGVKDRPIIRFYNGVFNASNVVKHSGSNGTNCPQFQFHGGVFNGTISTNRALNQFYGGTFTGSLMMSVDSSAYTLIAGGTFKSLSNLCMSALNSGKFTIGSAKGVYDKEVYIDDNGNYVIAAAEPAQGIEAAVAKTPGTNDYLAYSKVATEGVLKYTDATMALQQNNTSSAKVTIYAEELDLAGIDYKGTIIVPEGKTLKITNAPEGLKVEGDVVVVKPVAKIGETSYNSLSDAIADATAGQTITFIANITEDVTISKAVTIDGAGKTYTGAMTLKADTTIKNVNFDGKGYNGYAITTRGAQYLTIEDCTAKNYGYGFVQLASATALTTVKNVTVSNVNYGVKVDYSSAVVLENVDINAAVAAVLNSNYGEKTITIKNSKLSILGTWTRNNTIKTNYIFEGANTIDSFITDAAIDSFKLAAGATLTAPEGVTVTTDVDGKMVVYTNGTYELDLKHQGGTWGGIDWKLYEDGTLIIAPTKGTPVADAKGRTYEVGEWRERVVYSSKDNAKSIGGAPYSMNAVKKLIIEDGVTSIGSFTAQFPNLTGEVVIPSTVTYIGQEAFQKAPMTKLTFAAGGTEELCIAQGAFKNLIIEEVSLPADRPVHLHAWVFNNCHNLKNVTLPATLVSVHGTNHIDYFADFNAHSNPTWTQSSEIFAYNENMETITFGSEAVRDMFYAKNNGTSKDYTVANVGLTTYFDLQAAIDAAQGGETVKLIKNVTLTDTLTIPAGKTITLDLSGKTISQSKACDAHYAMIENKGNLTITGNGKISFTDTGAGDSNFGWGSYTINNSGMLVVENGTIENLSQQNKDSVVHMYCAIQQAAGSTTINGGTITTSYYRTVRINGGDLIINGGTFNGQVWLQPNQGNTTLKVTDGTFAPAGNDGSSIFLTNAGEGKQITSVAISGGTFTTKVGATDAAALAGSITGGKFSESAKNGTNVALLAEGAIFGAVDGDGYYSVVAAVASVNGVSYDSLAAAINAAVAGDKITLLTDVNENVTVNKNLTIDGANYKYTGKMTLIKVNVTIENVNFVKGTVYKNKNTGATDSVVIRNCTFDGQSMADYAINLGAVNYITIEDVTAKDYGYGLLQVPSSCAGLTVKNVTVSGCYYGLKVDYANAVTIENADIDANIGIYDSNYGTKTYTIKNSKISSISIWDRKTGLSTTFKFEGVNEVATLSTSAYAKYTGVQVGTKIYDSLANAWAAAQDGDTIKVLGDIAVSEGITNTKKVTLDLNGKTITGTDNATGSFGLITNKGELTITGNGKITLTATNNRGWNAYSSVISNTVGGKLIVENGTIEHLGGTDMAYGIDNLTNGKGTYAETIINGGTIKSTYRAIRMFLNGVEAQNILTVNGGVIEGTNKSIWVQDPSKNANTGKITVAAGAVLNGDVYLYATAGSAEWPVEVSIAASAVKNEVITGNLPNGYILEKKSGNWTVNEYFFKVGNKYYKDLQSAVNAASQYQSVVLLQDAEGAGVVINKKISIDFAGFTYTLTEPVGSKGTESNGFQILAGDYTVRLLNGTLKVADSAKDKFYILVQNYADLVVQKMTLDGTNLDKYALTDGDSYTLSNNSGNVQINMATIIANNEGDKAFAFDVCDKSAWGYELPRVIVYTGSKIEGKIEAVAKVGNYYYATLQQAIDATAEGKTITLLAPIVVNAGETLNLNKKVTISYTSNVAGEDMITNRGTVIVDGATLVYKNTDTTANNVTVSTISCEPGSKLEVKSGVVKNNSANNGALGIYAYAIDMLTNGSLGNVTATISGGQVICTNYMAIRQFNNGDACKNTLNVTGGYIYGAKRAIQIHFKNNAAYLTISGGEIEAGDYALCLLTTSANVSVTGGEFVGAIWYSGTKEFITGGTFDAVVDEAYIVDGYKLNKVDGAYTVIVDTAYGKVATIGDKGYSSLAEAWADAQSGDTIVLQNNIAIDTETFTVADGKKITLDMNGYTITVTDNATANYELFYIYGEMVVTGKGTIELTSTNNRAWNAMSAIFHNRGGVLIIENGTFKNLGGTDMAWVVDNSGNYYGDAITNIKDGELTSTYTAIRNRMEQNTHGASGKAILNVYGGTIDGTTSAIWAQAASTSTVAPATGEINIYGGNIGLINTARSAGAVSLTTISGGTVAGFKGESGELKVTGGTITGDITICFADGEVAEKIVKKSNVYYAAVAKINKTYYATLADAVKANTGAQAITLIRDVEATGFVVAKKMTLDLNGYTLTLTAPVGDTGCGIQINTDKAVRIVNGTLKAADNAGINVLVENNGAALTIQKQTIEATNVEKALVVNSGSASLNYAKINAEGAIAFEVNGTGKVTVYASSKIVGTIDGKKSGTAYIAK